MLRALAAIGGFCLLVAILVDVFNSIILARRVQGLFRITRYFYRATWSIWIAAGRRLCSGKQRESYLSVYGPLSLLILIAVWASALICAFGLLQWSAGLHVKDLQGGFLDALYFSATTLITLAEGSPVNEASSWLTALTAVVDASAVTLLCGGDELQRQARLTFAMGRHCLIDMATVFDTPPSGPREDRLSPDEFRRLSRAVEETHGVLRLEDLAGDELAGLRRCYEPYAAALAERFLMTLPSWTPGESNVEDWRVTPWERNAIPSAVSTHTGEIADDLDVTLPYGRGVHVTTESRAVAALILIAQHGLPQ